TVTRFSPLLTRPAAAFGPSVRLLTAARAAFAATFAAVSRFICANASCAKAHKVASNMPIEQSFMFRVDSSKLLNADNKVQKRPRSAVAARGAGFLRDSLSHQWDRTCFGHHHLSRSA